MKMRTSKGTALGGVPAKTGGYNYGTGNAENTLFNQGLTPGDPGAPQAKYDYSAKGRAQRINGHQDMVGGYASVQQPGAVRKDSTDSRKALKVARINKGLRHS